MKLDLGERISIAMIPIRNITTIPSHQFKTICITNPIKRSGSLASTRGIERSNENGLGNEKEWEGR